MYIFITAFWTVIYLKVAGDEGVVKRHYLSDILRNQECHLMTVFRIFRLL